MAILMRIDRTNVIFKTAITIKYIDFQRIKWKLGGAKWILVQWNEIVMN